MSTETRKLNEYERSTLDRVSKHYRVNEETGCWEWVKGMRTNGYGVSWYKGRAWVAHRVLWDLYVGEVPDGRELDHLCRVRKCVNPAHLEPVTRKENQRRSPVSPLGINLRKARCKRGHEFTEENTYVKPKTRGTKNPQRECVVCKKNRDRKAYLRRKAEHA